MHIDQQMRHFQRKPWNWRRWIVENNLELGVFLENSWAVFGVRENEPFKNLLYGRRWVERETSVSRSCSAKKLPNNNVPPHQSYVRAVVTDTLVSWKFKSHAMIWIFIVENKAFLGPQLSESLIYPQACRSRNRIHCNYDKDPFFRIKVINWNSNQNL